MSNLLPLNLLDYLALRHTQLTQLHAELTETINPQQRLQAKVELNLSPRESTAKTSDNELPIFQIITSLTCEGFNEENGQKSATKAVFTARVSLLATYQQIQGEPLTFDDFKHQHPPLTRQLYPLTHAYLRTLMQQIGLDNVQLPFDLINQQPERKPKVSLH